MPALVTIADSRPGSQKCPEHSGTPGSPGNSALTLSNRLRLERLLVLRHLQPHGCESAPSGTTHVTQHNKPSAPSLHEWVCGCCVFSLDVSFRIPFRTKNRTLMERPQEDGRGLQEL